MLRVTGEIDALTAPRLARWLSEAEASGPGCVLLDLSAVSFIDSQGLGVLVRAVRSRHPASGVRLVAPSRQVSRVLTMCGLDRLFRTYESMEAADAARDGGRVLAAVD